MTTTPPNPSQETSREAAEGETGATITTSIREPMLVSADELEWVDAPASMPEGVEMAVLDGDMSAPDRLFAVRLRMPAGYRLMPHWHPADEHVTVISGEYRLGEGDTFALEATRTYGAGSYFALPAGHPHFSTTVTESVIQLHGVGPWQINYVNPADDPRKH
jgi:quercetin dioxygenase-like cupin family protein